MSLWRDIAQVRFEGVSTQNIPLLLSIPSGFVSTTSAIWLGIRCKDQETLNQVDWEAFDASFPITSFPKLLHVNMSFRFDDWNLLRIGNPDTENIKPRCRRLNLRGLYQESSRTFTELWRYVFIPP